ncbi:type 2C protein phosphatase PTC1 [Cyberlindnera jadinii NRRL Y-1542]|uniref:Protein phosphatase 2C n=1 Tax=Cyberlindnera jadinii (strain ATCC 18201 / CBS 1600 / BCRC 20928 / JCM 3617 / NBRC 0987 / NRRL Y-1542) TaxID=983966 RepID=A0A1E4S8Y5_CYBJN|nr:protein phosphatase 2C [Cyberlindnera jadinii NRRL Y-1542]ODV75975.1 protein phosphatase 2C [Cyberlindnera jadinii NRRL Y-1542]
MEEQPDPKLLEAKSSSSTACTHADRDKRSSSSSASTKYKLTYSVGVAENVNTRYRPTMEDVHTYVENFVERLDWGYFAVFDGHAGKEAAKWCGQHLHTLLGDKLIREENRDVRELLNETFIKADSEIAKNVRGSSGCTAAVAVIRWELPQDGEAEGGVKDEQRLSLDKHRRMLYTANVGDSRIVLFRSGKAVRLTYDHKASDKLEIKRIEENGGLIMKNRVNGMLAVTRSLGDQFFKDLVIGNPYTTSLELDMETDKFIIIACDGLWDVISDQKACELIQGIEDANVAAKTLVDYAMEKQTTDNVTVMVIKLG